MSSVGTAPAARLLRDVLGSFPTGGLRSLDGFRAADACAINFLRQDQAHLSAQFATPLAGKWRGVELRTGATGSPVLVPALAVLECRSYARYDGADHILVVGRVDHLEMDAARHPLVFFRGRYHALAKQEGA
jgi:flavin reductase (DIM6/NTAB) family NADH-FMN oxidoreductase RutF